MLTQIYGTLDTYQIDALENVWLNKIAMGFDPVISYNRAWQNVYCIAYLVSLLSNTSEGVSQVILDTNYVTHHIEVDFKPMYIAPFEDGFLFTISNNSQLFYYNFDEFQTFVEKNVAVELEPHIIHDFIHHLE